MSEIAIFKDGSYKPAKVLYLYETNEGKFVRVSWKNFYEGIYEKSFKIEKVEIIQLQPKIIKAIRKFFGLKVQNIEKIEQYIVLKHRAKNFKEKKER